VQNCSRSAAALKVLPELLGRFLVISRRNNSIPENVEVVLGPRSPSRFFLIDAHVCKLRIFDRLKS